MWRVVHWKWAHYWPSWHMGHLHRSGKHLHQTLRLHYCLGSSGRGLELWWGPDSPGSPGLVKLCGMCSCHPRNLHYQPCCECHGGEGNRCPGDAMGKHPSPVSTKGYSHSGGQPSCRKSSPCEYDEVIITKNVEIIDAFSSRVIPVKMEKGLPEGKN